MEVAPFEDEHYATLPCRGKGKTVAVIFSSWLRDLSIAAYHLPPAAHSRLRHYFFPYRTCPHTYTQLSLLYPSSHPILFTFPLPSVTTRFVAGIAKGDRNQVCPNNLLQSDQPTAPTAHTLLRERRIATGGLYLQTLRVLRPLPLLRQSHHCIYPINLFRLLDLVLHSIIHPSIHPFIPNSWPHLSNGTRRRAQTELTVEEIALGSQKAAPHLPSAPDITTHSLSANNLCFTNSSLMLQN